MLRQAYGIPNGNHGSGGKYNIDSVTLEFKGKGRHKTALAANESDRRYT